MARGMKCCICGEGADYIYFIPRDTVLSTDSFVKASIYDVDPESVLWTWKPGEFGPEYIGQCSMYFCSSHVGQAGERIEAERSRKW